jgi:uncharacterized protein
MKKPKLPNTDSIEKLAEFWDTHGLTDFEDELEEVAEPVFVRAPAIRRADPRLGAGEARSSEQLARNQALNWGATSLFRGSSRFLQRPRQMRGIRRLMLPGFRYHPNPIATGSVKPSEVACACCGQARGFIYEGSVYGGARVAGSLCPWCIASGAAASRFNVFFSVEDSLVEAGVPRQAIIEVTRRTPGYNSWQQDEWQVCCGDACAFHGDATLAELKALEGERLARLQKRWPISPERWTEFLKAHVPGGGISVFRFVCCHCGEEIFALDLA